MKLITGLYALDCTIKYVYSHFFTSCRYSNHTHRNGNWMATDRQYSYQMVNIWFSYIHVYDDCISLNSSYLTLGGHDNEKFSD